MYKRRNKVFLVRECDYRAHVDVTTLRQSWVLCWFFSPGSSALGARWSGWHTFWDRHRRTPCLNRLPSSWTGTVFPGSPSGRPPRKLVLGSRLSPLPYPAITDNEKKKHFTQFEPHCLMAVSDERYSLNITTPNTKLWTAEWITLMKESVFLVKQLFLLKSNNFFRLFVLGIFKKKGGGSTQMYSTYPVILHSWKFATNCR